MSFSGKRYIVTGAGSGMGRDVALALLREGAQVLLVGRSKAKGEAVMQEASRLSGRAVFFAADVSDPLACQGMAETARKEFGGLDGAFNNAGYQEQFAKLHKTPDELIDGVIGTNLKGVLYSMKYQLSLLLQNGSGAIVNNSSIFGLKAMPDLAYYVASKFGVVGATKAAALDYARNNIRINAICPGPVKTPSYDKVTGGDNHMYDDGVPMHRIAAAGEVTNAVLWLLSDQASYVTGQTLSVDGGMSAA